MANLSVRSLTAQQLARLDCFGRTRAGAIGRCIDEAYTAREQLREAHRVRDAAVQALTEYADACEAAKLAMDREAVALAKLLKAAKLLRNPADSIG